MNNNIFYILKLPFNLAFSFSMRINNTCWLIAFFHNALKSDASNFLTFSVSKTLDQMSGWVLILFFPRLSSPIFCLLGVTTFLKIAWRQLPGFRSFCSSESLSEVEMADDFGDWPTFKNLMKFLQKY